MEGLEVLKISKLSTRAILPQKATQESVGWDLFSPYEYLIPPGDSCLVKTDIQIRPPPGTYARIAGRSGMGLKNLIQVLGGVVDPDYTGNVGVILLNHGKEAFCIEPGQKIAQMVLERFSNAKIELVDNLEVTQRGAKGFGSSGR